MHILDFDRTRDAQALREFAAEVWNRPTADAYWQWWFSCPSLDGVVAYGDDGRLLAVLFGILRPYEFGDRQYDCLEPFDWFSRPDVVGSTVGLALMRRFLKRGHPIVVLGANPVAAQVMRALGFKDVADGRAYWLPFGPQPLVERGRNALSARAFGWVGHTFRIAWRRPRPVGAELRLVNGAPNGAPRSEGGIAPTPAPALLRWLREATPEVGIFLSFQVDVNGSTAIWALTRVAGPDLSRRSWILEWHDYARDPAIADWALTSVLETLVRMGTTAIHAATTDPELQRQLERRRFRVDGHPVALLWLPKGGPSITGQIRFMGSQADNSYLPLT